MQKKIATWRKILLFMDSFKKMKMEELGKRKKTYQSFHYKKAKKSSTTGNQFSLRK